ncbi:MAG TPA: enoyl-CoA hydratase/isomerase family protein [Candidatus Dormibacteraeota bacterium]|nr:enoyl-CoA hydratase/isomerase family protein [Candidatus Dormibacteraeota bacterium]
MSSVESGPGVQVERAASGVLLLTLNRPDQRNALTRELAAELRARLDEVRSDPTVRALVITGNGSAFCAGADLGALTADAETPAHRRALLSDYYRAFLDLRDLPIPTIAAVNGPAIGAGLNLALCCDLRLLAEGARLAAPFLRLGIHPGGGGTWLLTRIAGTAAAREILFLGHQLTAARAQELGLATAVVSADRLREVALEWAGDVATLPGPVVRDLKRTLNLAESGTSFEATLAFESAAQGESMASDDAKEGWAAFRERRAPRFQDR